MPIFYKQGGTWKNVSASYVKQKNNWIQPDELYVKRDGEWRLVFEEFAFEVETYSPQTDGKQIKLKGELIDYESEKPFSSFFLDKTFEEGGTVTATATDENRKLIAAGGSGGVVYLYDNNSGVDTDTQTLYGNRKNYIETLIEPSGNINGMDFFAGGEILAVASNQLYIYDSNFEVINVFQTANPVDGFEDVKFDESGGTLAAGSVDESIYIYEEQPDESWAEDQNVGSPINSAVSSVSWDAAGNLAVGGTDEIYILDSSYSKTNTLTDPTGEVNVEFSLVSGKLAAVGDDYLHVWDATFLNRTQIEDSTEGPEGGDIDWDGSEYLFHGSTDSNVRIYDGVSSLDLVETFTEPSNPLPTVDCDRKNQYAILGSTNGTDSGKTFKYSIGVRTFFDWSAAGGDFENRRRASGLRETGTFEVGLKNLESEKDYEFRSGGIGKNGRTVTDGVSLGFTTPKVQVSTTGSSVQTNSAVLEGTVDLVTGSSGDVHTSFKWAKQSRKLENEISAGIIDSSNVPKTFSATLTGLSQSQQYKFKAKTQHGGVTVLGSETTFTTKDVTAKFGTSVDQPTNFRDVFVSSPTAPETKTKTITVKEESGTGDYNITTASADGDFTVLESFPITVLSGDERSFDLQFDPSSDGKQITSLELTHDADSGENPLSVGIEGRGVNPSTLEIKETDPSLTAFYDGSEHRKSFTIVETGSYHQAEIQQIVEDSNQDGSTVESNWQITNRPGTLGSGGTATVQPNEQTTFEVGWNPDSSNASSQTYRVDILYDGSGIPDDYTLNVPIDGKVDETLEISIDPERDGAVTTSYTFPDTVNTGGAESVTPFSAVVDPVGEYRVTNMEIIDDNENEFEIRNAPSDATDGDSTTYYAVNSTNGDLEFDVAFTPDPDFRMTRTAKLQVTAEDSSGTALPNSPLDVNLDGYSVEPSEIVIEDEGGNVIPSGDELSFGSAIVGGNLQSKNERAIETLRVKNEGRDQDFYVQQDRAEQVEFDLINSVSGLTIQNGKPRFPQIEFKPKIGGGSYGDYTDDQTIESDGSESIFHEYNLYHDATVSGADPYEIKLVGEIQISQLNCVPQGGTAFDVTSSPSTFQVFGAPDGNVDTRTFEISLPGTENDVSTRVKITDDTSDTAILNLDENKEAVIEPGGSVTAKMNYNPQNLDSDIGVTEDIQLKWDNETQSTTITAEGASGSVVDIETQDGTPDDEVLDFGQVTENETKTQDIVVKEEQGVKDFEIQSSEVSNSDGGVFSIDDGFDSTTVSKGSPVTATVKFAPDDTDGGIESEDPPSKAGEFNIEHDALYAPDFYEEADPYALISLEGEVLNQVFVTMDEASDSDPLENEVNFEAYYELNNSDPDAITLIDSQDIDIKELGQDNDATIESFEITEASDGSFGLNNNPGSRKVDYSNYSGSEDNKNPVSSGGSITEPVVKFNPTEETGDPGDYTVEGELTVTYSGPGVGSPTNTIDLSGEVIRPAKANVKSIWPIVFGDGSNDGNWSNSVKDDPSFEVYKTFEIEEVNNVNSYTVTGVEIEKYDETASSVYENVTTTSPPEVDSVIDPNHTVSPGGSSVGAIRFNPSKSGYFSEYIKVIHNAPHEESGEDESILDDPDDILAIPIYASVTSYLSSGISSVNLPTETDEKNDGIVTFGSVSEALEPVTITLSVTSGPGNVENLSVKEDVNILNIDDTVGTTNESQFRFQRDENGEQDLRIEYDVTDSVSEIEVEVQGVESGNSVTYTTT